MTVGHRWLSRNLGYVPTYSWQLDPFGHSRSFAYLFDIMGFNGHIIGRIDDWEKLERMHNKKGEPAM